MKFTLCTNDWTGASIALEAFKTDFAAVFGDAAANANAHSISEIIVGTVGKSTVIEGLTDTTPIANKRESYVIEEIPHNDGRTLVIAGSDKRGTIYGIYKLSELIGVSPWVWWADSVPAKRDRFELAQGFRIVQGEPSVKYRGFFTNDEAPSLSGWVGKNFGSLANPSATKGYDSAFYARVFELLLRLKGNYYWPTMWNNSFHTDDPKNSKLADDMGIVMGTSHHEHMTCADKEWNWANRGAWNYHTNRENIYDFWKQGTSARRDYEAIVTLGMRGQADTSILGPDATIRDNIALLQKVIDDQREILKDVHGDAEKAPQMIALYKEVEDFYYGDGTGEVGSKLNVPEDVTLMLCDDNFGNLRTLPTPEMLKRKGGFGMYYHFDYRGAPVSYEWINQTPLPKVWDNMTAAYDAGIRDIWIVNVGDLKPMEFPLEYFMNLAYDFGKWSEPNKTDEFTHAFCAREFGENFAKEAAEVLTDHQKILGARKAEVVHPTTFSLAKFCEADRILAQFEAVVKKAEKIYDALPEEKKAAFFQLALYPTRAAYNVYKMSICAAKGDADGAKTAYDANAADTEYYNVTMSGGKWDGIMRQNHTLYTNWDSALISPVPNAMPEIASEKFAPSEDEPCGGCATTPCDSTSEKAEAPANLPPKTYLQTNDYVSINPSNFTKNTPVPGGEFIVIQNYGREGDSVKVLPNTASFAENDSAPSLEYSFYLHAPADYAITFFLQPTNPPINDKITPITEQMRFGVQLNDGERATVCGMPDPTFAAGASNPWYFGVLDNVRYVQVQVSDLAKHLPAGGLEAGVHSLKISAIDPAVIIQKIVIAPAAEKPVVLSYEPRLTHFMGSYFGPPESILVGVEASAK